MKKTRNKATAWLVAALALSFAYNAKCDDTTAAQTGPDAHYQNSGTRTAAGMPEKCNKASSLIGMDVENQNGEHLGHIRDIVFDLKTDRVSYVVMTTSPKVTLGIDEKLLAVPLSAFTTNPDGKRLILNADKAKVESAMGFNKNNWPDVANPAWGAQPFWQNSTGQQREQNGTQYNNGNSASQPNANPNQPNPDTQNPPSGTRPDQQGQPPQK